MRTAVRTCRARHRDGASRLLGVHETHLSLSHDAGIASAVVSRRAEVRTAYDAATVRAAEEPLLATQPEGTLMALAASGLARVCAGLLDGVYGARVLLLVGAGNNGGDALYAGALLAGGAHGSRPCCSPTGCTRPAWPRCGGQAAGSSTTSRRTGPGGRRPPGHRRPRRPARPCSRGRRPAAGGRTGGRGRRTQRLDASTGEVDGVAVRADVTVTFGGLKVGLLVDPGADHAGVVELIDIGLDLPPAAVEVLQADDVAALLPRPDRESDKYRRGVVGVAAGSAEYTGAAVLCTGGALHGGVGMVRYLGDDEPAALVRARWPEVVVGEGRVQAWTVGSGGGADAAGGWNGRR